MRIAKQDTFKRKIQDQERERKDSQLLAQETLASPLRGGDERQLIFLFETSRIPVLN